MGRPLPVTEPPPASVQATPSRFRARLLERAKGKGPETKVWALFFSLFVSVKDRFPKVAAENELNPMHLRLLLGLYHGERLVQRDLAQLLSCDASNVTALVDRLEERGLVERRALLADRRAKVLQLTPAGEAFVPKVIDRLIEPPQFMEALSSVELKQLTGLLEKLHAEATQEPRNA